MSSKARLAVLSGYFSTKVLFPGLFRKLHKIHLFSKSLQHWVWAPGPFTSKRHNVQQHRARGNTGNKRCFVSTYGAQNADTVINKCFSCFLPLTAHPRHNQNKEIGLKNTGRLLQAPLLSECYSYINNTRMFTHNWLNTNFGQGTTSLVYLVISTEGNSFFGDFYFDGTGKDGDIQLRVLRNVPQRHRKQKELWLKLWK